MKKTLSIISFFVIIINISLYSQEQIQITEAKNAADVVGEFSGTYSTNIPVGTVTSGSLSIPISLFYNYDGFKPLQKSSPFGHGWGLGQPATIYKIQRGANDANWNNVPLYYPNFTANNNSFVNGTLDGAPDLYTFNVLGYIGNFLHFSGNSNVSFVSKTDIKIEYISNANFLDSYYKVILPNGTICKLFAATNASLNGEAWYGQEFYSYDLKDTILLDYDNYMYKYNSLVDSVIIKSGNVSLHNSKEITLTTSILKSAIGKNNSIIFEYENRLDLNVPQPLKCSKIKSLTGSNCFEFLLNSTYDNPSGQYSQIKLNGIRMRNCVNYSDSMPGYKFTYYSNTPTPFTPRQTSNDIDEWGYGNDIYDLPANSNLNMTPNYISGGSANRNIHFISTLHNAIKTVTYPTGGITTIEYEQNSFVKSMDNLIDVFPKLIACSPSLTCYGTYTATSALTTISTEHILDGNLKLYIEAENPQGNPQGQIWFYIKNSSNSIIYTRSFNTISNFTDNVKLSNILNGSQQVLVAGQSYYFEVVTNNGYGFAECTYFGVGTNAEKLCGGLRVKKLTTSNGNAAKDVVTNYTYKNGVQYSSPRFSEVFNGSNLYYNRNLLDENFTSDFNIGYSEITITKPGVGKIIKKFKADYNKIFDSNFLVITSKEIGGVGLLLSTSTYNLANVLISKDSFEYLIESFNNFLSYPSHEYFLNVGGQYYGYSYKYHSYLIRPKKILKYYLQFSSPITTEEYVYGYSTTIQPSIVKLTYGDGNITETWRDYTNNLNTNTAINNYFNSKNIKIPFTTKIYENGIQISSQVQNYSFFNNSGTHIGSSSTDPTHILRPYEMFKGDFNLTGTQTNITSLPEFYNLEYTNQGFVKREKRLNWNEKIYSYDNYERFTQVSENTFSKSITYYNNSSLIHKKYNFDGTYEEIEYDGLNRVKKIIAQPSGVTKEFFHLFYNSNSPRNAIKTKITYHTTPVSGSNLTVVENIIYSDLLGRKIAEIGIKASPNQLDVIKSFEYDNQGRLIKEYLPVESIYNDGTYLAPLTTWKFIEYKYELSPLSRVVETIPADWYPTKYEYGLNTLTDNILKQSGGSYVADKLYKETKIDENGNKLIIFTDFKGRIICERKTDANDTPSNRRDTYTYFDIKNRVVKIIPPDATQSNSELIFEYTYDDENKVTSKKIPGKGLVNYYYNDKDLVAVEQDAIQASKNPKEWIVYSYDNFGRQLKSGLNVGNTLPNLQFPAFSVTYTENTYGTSGIEIDKIKTRNVNILGTNNTLNTTFNYDSRGRVQSCLKNNIHNLTGSNTVSYSYDNGDNLLSQSIPVTVVIGSSSTHTVVNSYTYDHRGRLIDENFQYNGSVLNTIGTNVYNWKDQTVRIRQGKYNATTYLQDIDFTYRQNGILEKINDYLGTGTTGDLFYMQFYYDNPIAGTTASQRKNGEISNIKWQSRNATLRGGIHAFTYNEFGELLTNDYSSITGASTFSTTANYDETFAYNGKFGKITGLIRKSGSGGIIDNLTYNYINDSPRISHINDVSSNVIGHNQNGQSTSTQIYQYDANGNQKNDPYRGVSNINYNHLNLPVLIDLGGGKRVELKYDAEGNMLEKKIFNTGSVILENRTYNNSMEFVAYGTGNQALEMITHSQGYYKPSVSRHFYTILDHLGSTRIVYTDADNNGIISQTATEILDENHFYAHGMEMMSPSWFNSAEYNYKFNGIERTQNIGLNIDLAFYRGLDPVLGKWYQIDPAAESVYYMTPYCAMGNNPILFADPNGDIIPYLIAAGVGAVINVKNNWSKIVANPKSAIGYFAAGAVGGAVSLANPVAGAAIVGWGNVATDIATGQLPEFNSFEDIASYAANTTFDAFDAAGAGAIAKMGIKGLKDLGVDWAKEAVENNVSLFGETVEEIVEYLPVNGGGRDVTNIPALEIKLSLSEITTKKLAGPALSSIVTSTTNSGLGLTPPTLPDKTIVNQDGVKIEHYYKSNDHKPAHAHVVGGGPETKIGANGKPLSGFPELTKKQSEVVLQNKGTIRTKLNKIKKWLYIYGK